MRAGWPCRRNERGFALIAALGLLVIFSVIGLEFSLLMRSRSLAAANASEVGRAHGAALAGVQHALARLDRLLDGRGEPGPPSMDQMLDPWAIVPDLFQDTVKLSDVSYRIVLADANARLQLNRASSEEIRRLLVALRLDAGVADRIAQSVEDWRDADDFRRARGAERQDYLKWGSAVLPPNAPFASVSDLQHVHGITPEIFRMIRPYFTVAGTGQVNLNSATPPVLLSLPGMSDEAVAIILRHRRSRLPLRNLLELASELPRGPRERLQDALPRLIELTTFSTYEVEVASDGWADGGVVHVHAAALVTRAGGTALLTWQGFE